MQNVMMAVSLLVYLAIVFVSIDVRKTLSAWFPWKTGIFLGVTGIIGWGYYFTGLSRHPDFIREYPFIPWFGFLFSIFLAWSFFEMRKYSLEWKKAREKDEETTLFLKTILDNSPMYVGRLDSEGRILSVEGENLEAKGYRISDIIGKSVFSLFADNIILTDFFERVLKGEQISGETPGRNGIYDLFLNPIKDSNGNPNGAIGFGADITSRKRIERELRETLRQYKALTDTAHDFIFVIDGEFRVMFVNKYGAKIFGKSPEDLTGKPMRDLFPPQNAERMTGNIRDIFNTGEAKYIESQVGFPPGIRWLDTRLIPMRNDKDEIYAVLGVSRDISDRKNSEEARRRSEEKYHMILEKAGEGIFVYDREGIILDANQRGCELSGFSREELIGLNPLDTAPPETREEMRKKIQQISEKKNITFELQQYRKDGALRQIECSCTLLPDTNILGIVRDITEKRREEELMRITSFSIDNMMEAIFWVDAEGRFVHVNEAACRSLGYSMEELLSKRLDDVDPLEKIDKWPERWEAMKKAGRITIESIHRKKDGKEFPAEIRISYLQFLGKEYLCGFARDITERRQFEEERLRAQKLESIGVLAGGIAHDFNNILTIILGNISLARKNFECGGSVVPKLIEAEKGAMRARDLTRQLLTFSLAGAPVKKAASIGELVRESASFVLRGSKIIPEFHIPDSLWPAEVDEAQISRVISNLVINAQQAIQREGKIIIICENLDFEQERGMPPAVGRYVRITVKDEGMGIPPEVLPRIFEPYFSTKSSGSGLGLAISYSIVRRHNGHISVESEINRGTTFYVYLPATSKGVEKETVSNNGGFKGHGWILVMDDEEAIRALAGDAITRLGFEVDFAVNGEEAVKKYKARHENGNPFRAVIMDLTIPGGLGGKDAMQQIREIDPSARGIVSSGYSIDPIMADFEKFGFVNVIAKPYRAEDLYKCLEEVLSTEDRK